VVEKEEKNETEGKRNDKEREKKKGVRNKR